MAFSKTLKDKRLLIQCDCCFRDITLDPFIRCTECTWDQCLVCFFADIETEQHKSTHSYRFMSRLDMPLLYSEWRIIDELLLLNGVITFGIGNFEDIASVLSPKTESAVKNHFFALFGITNNEEDEAVRAEVPKSDPNDSAVLSYMSKRQDFESEIFNDYEVIINGLQYSDSDGELERSLKQYMLRHYRTVLKQRSIWKALVLERGLVEVGALKLLDAGEAGVFTSRYKWLVQYLSKNDFNKYIDGLIREKYLWKMRAKGAAEHMIDGPRLADMSGLLSEKEKELCRRLKMSPKLYVRLKRFTIECYIAKKPLRRLIFGLFDESEQHRIGILYRWFENQKLVHPCREGMQ